MITPVIPITTVGEMVYVILFWIIQNIVLMEATVWIMIMNWTTESHVAIMNAVPELNGKLKLELVQQLI